MHVLLIIAHGSRVQQSNQELRDLAMSVANVVASVEKVNLLDDPLDEGTAQPCAIFDDVEVAFLELTHPTISESIDKLVQKGVTQITALPYFLAAGRHVRDDIPGEIKLARQRHPHVNILMTPWFGSFSSLPNLLRDFAAQEVTQQIADSKDS